VSRTNPRRPQQEQARRIASATPFSPAPIAAAVVALMLVGSAHAQSAASAAPAASAASAASVAAASNEAPALDAVTVHSRNRIERLQDVPVSVSVVTGAELERLDAYGVSAIAKRAANVSWNIGNQRTSSLSIRGIGKIGQTEAQDPSVGVIVDGVSYGYNALTSSFDFVDIDTIEVARGPQGTLQGKNASVGSITVNTKRPSFTPTADYTLAFNKNNGVLGVAAIGGPVIDNLLAWRGTFSVDRQQGPRTNAYNRDQTYTNTDRVSGRVQFLLTPNDNFSARFEGNIQPRAGETTNGNSVFSPTPTQYADGAPNPLSTDAATRLSRSWFTNNPGYSLADYYSGINNDAQHALVTGSDGLTTELNWKIPSGQTLTSITAYKSYHFNAVNDDGTPFDIYRNSGGFWNDYHQVSQELRISSAVGGFVDYQAGLYFIKVNNSSTYQRAWGNDAGAWFASSAQYTTLDATAAGQLLMRDSLANVSMAYNSPAGQQTIENKSGAVFAQANWHFTDRLTLTTGARLTHENRTNVSSSYVVNPGDGVDLANFNSADVTLQNAAAAKYFGTGRTYASLTAAELKQVTAAQAIRSSNIGVLFGPTAAKPFKANQPALVLSPSFKISPDVTSYASYQHGEKAGIAQLVNGVSTPAAAEKTNSFELGLKSALLDKTLILNADIFDTRIQNYQQAVQVVDEYTTTQKNDGNTYYTSATGNAPKVGVTGLEIDGVYGGIRHTTLRFSGAYNKAVYKDFPNAAQPVENGDLTSLVTSGAFQHPAEPYRSLNGKTLAGAPRFTFNVGADYNHPVSADKDAHVSANLAYSTSYNSDVSLSKYAVVGAQALVDLAVGAGKHDKSFDVSLIFKNLFNNQTPQSRTWNSITPANPRTYGIQFTGKL
jgi:outer membrane receptor protein involved in Fe transport